MSVLNTRSFIFGINCYLAVVMALFIAYSLNLSNPMWAVITVFITSQPFAGAILSKAYYRVLGTLIGAAAALIIVPSFVDTPILLMVVMACWVGFCLYLSLLDRTPKGYVIMLAGYTAALVGLPQIIDPTGLFDNALARAEEITIGVVCTTLTHSLIFPRTAEGAVLGKLNATLADVKNWMIAALSAEPESAARTARRRIAIDLTELTIIGTNFRFEITASRPYINAILALEERLITVLPLLNAIEDRLQALRQSGEIPPRTEHLVNEVKAWITGLDIKNIAVNKDLIERSGQSSEQLKIAALIEECHAIAVMHVVSPTWRDILELNLVTRIKDLVEAWADCLALYAAILQPYEKPNRIIKEIVSIDRKRPLHVDRGLAMFSAASAGIAVLTCAGFAMVFQWTQGIAAVGLAAVMCCIFATFDNPVMMQRKMFMATITTFPVAALYVFGIFPAIDSFPLMALSLFPLMVPIGMFISNPPTFLGGLSFGILVVSGIGFSPSLHLDFPNFVIGNLVGMAGVLVAIVVTLFIRVIRVDVSIHRILKAGWEELAQHATGKIPKEYVTWASLMLDRLGLLIPRLAIAQNSESLKIDNALKDLPIGFNILELRIAAKGMPQSIQNKINILLKQLEGYFLGMAKKGYEPPKTELVAEIDAIITEILNWRSLPYTKPNTFDTKDLRLNGLIASTGLRRNLFPHAAAYQPVEYLA
ncbi:FUSC family protein [Aquirhabdus sp.]|uniref:FUSC family protein n=1 Tax=Aquirhabdus sp. TaxID=2824160 RepID=UPI00396CCDD5